MSVGKVLKAGRMAKGLTRKNLSALIDVNINSIAKYEQAGESSGQYPPLPILAKIVSVLNISPSEIFEAACNDEEDKIHFKTAPLRTLAPILKSMFYLREAAADIDVNLDQAMEELKSIMPSQSNREELQKDIKNAFPNAKQSPLPHSLDRFFFEKECKEEIKGYRLNKKNGPDHDDLSRSENQKNNPKTVEAVSAALTKKGKPDEVV